MILFFIFHEQIKTKKKFDFGVYLFSTAGRELRDILIDKQKNNKAEQYKKDFIKEAEKKGFKVKLLK
jgi:hypothetical protein